MRNGLTKHINSVSDSGKQKLVLSFALVLHGSLPCNALSAGNLRNEPDGQTPWENCGLVTIFADAPVLEWS